MLDEIINDLGDNYNNADFDGTPPLSLIKISDYYEDSVIYQIQYQVFNNHIDVNAYATKNYILRNYFTGVKSKIRSWAIAEAGEALTRHDLSKVYMEFSYSQHNELSTYLPTSFDWEYFAGSLTTSITLQPLRAACFSTISVDNDKYPTTLGDVYAIDLISRIIGNSIVFTFGLKDNVVVDKYVTGAKDVEDENGNIKYSGLATNNYRYADATGEFQTITYRLISELDGTFIPGSWNQTGDILKLRKRPEIVENTDILDSNELYKNTLTIWKDSQEITYVSTQIEYCSDTTDIYFTRKFLEYQKSVRVDPSIISDVNNLHVYYNSNNNYNFRSKELPASGNVDYNLITVIVDDSDNSLTIGLTIFKYPTESGARNVLLNKTGAFYIVNLSQELFLAMNNVPPENIIAIPYDGQYIPAIKIYLNPLKDRNKDLYSSRINDVPSSSI